MMSTIGKELRKLNRRDRRAAARHARHAGAAPQPKQLGVARPKNPTEAIIRAQRARATNDPKMLAAIITELPHTLVGYWGGPDNKEVILNGAGEVIGRVQPGDSFVSIGA